MNIATVTLGRAAAHPASRPRSMEELARWLFKPVMLTIGAAGFVLLFASGPAGQAATGAVAIAALSAALGARAGGLRAALAPSPRVWTVEPDAGQSEFDVLLNASPGVLYRLAGDDRSPPVLTFVSPNARSVLGDAAGVLRAPSDWRRATHPDDAAQIDAARQRALATGAADVKYRVSNDGRSWRWLHDQLHRVAARSDGSFELVGYLLDVTALRELEDKLAHTSRLALLGELATSMAHELTQPLAVIGVAAENLLDGLDDGDPHSDTAAARLHRITAQVERAGAIIEHMRAFGRISREDLGPVSLNDTVEQVLTLVAPRLRTLRVAVVTDIAEQAPPVRATRLQLEQVLINLLLNACDAFRQNPAAAARDRRIVVTARADGPAVLLRVEDNGGGIAPDLLPRIFEPFFTTKPMNSGTGLGLSVSSGIIAEFGGSITACNVPSSHLPKGARFDVRLLPWVPAPQVA